MCRSELITEGLPGCTPREFCVFPGVRRGVAEAAASISPVELGVVTNALFRADGIANAALSVAEEALSRGHNVTLIYPERPYDQPRLTDWAALGARIVGVDDLSIRRSDLASTSRGLFGALRTIRGLDLDVIHTHQPAQAAAAALASARSRTRVALHIHGQAPATIGRAQRVGLRSADLILPVSAATAVSWGCADSANTTVVHNGVDLERFAVPTLQERHTARAHLEIPDHATVLGFVGRFTREKGAFFLAEAFGELTKDRDDLWLVCVGATVGHKANRDRLAAMLGTDRVRLLDATPDVRSVLACCDIGVVPSETEAFSLVVLEMLAYGLPMCATDVGGTSEAVGDEFREWLVRFGDTKGLVAALRSLVERDDRPTLSELARTRAEHFDLRHARAKTVDLLEALPIGA